ncbi:MAG: hypothetical protein C0404_07770 [Verrucomicrobia bacterium]|nr:hypothetical protein [Verrucomicrobiota bacterium]
MNRKPLLVIFGAVTVLCVVMWYLQAQRVRKAISEAEGTNLNPGELASKAVANEGLWKQASEALARGDYAGASRLSGEAGSFEYQLISMPDAEIKPGLKGPAWFKAQKQAFGSNVVAAFDQVIANAVAVPGESHVFMDYYARYHHEVPELDGIYQSRKFEVAAARLKAADAWFRVAFLSEDADIVQPLKSTIAGAWDNRYGKTVVWGPVVDEKERAATWMLLDMDIRVDGASYAVKGQYQRILNIQVPERITVTRKLQKPGRIITSWDGLQPIVVSEKPPESIVAPEHELYSRVSEVADQYKKKLLGQLAEKLKAWPKFEVFPGRDPNATTLMKNGTIDHEAALVLSCLAPDKLWKEAAEATWTLQPPQRTELVKVAIDHNITSLVAWVTGVIHAETPQARKDIWMSLQKKPSFGGFDPVLAMQSRAEQDEEKAKIMEACKGYLFDQKVLNTVTGLLLRASFTRRGDMARLLLQECPHPMLASYTWLSADKDDNVAEMAIQIIPHRDQKLRWQMMIDHFDKWTPFRKSASLFNFHYNPREHGPEMLALLKRAAGRDQEESVRERAIHILMYETAETPEGWNILDEVRKTETDPKRVQQIKEALATSVNAANPAGAEAYLLNSMLEGSPEERKKAAHKYFRSQGSVDTKLKTIVPVLPRYLSEKGFFEALLRGFSEQGMSKLKDASAPELQTMIGTALASDDTMVRYFGVTLSHSAWSKGQKQYEPILAAFMQTETNKWLLGQASNYHRSMQPPKAAKSR